MIDVQVTTQGPIFDGRAQAAVDDYLHAAEDRVADQGVNRVQARLGRVLQNPTGFYESRITTDRQQDDTAVTDGGVRYGPWLEGTDSRNQTTRFKGYHVFRGVAQHLQNDAAEIAEQVLPKFIDRMNQ